MKKESWSIAFACALGAFIGALSALEIESYFAYGKYLWIFGALFGGLVAYLAVDFRQFCTSIARSYRMSASNIARAWRPAIMWRPNKLYWKSLIATEFAFSAILTSLVLFFVAGGLVDEYLRLSDPAKGFMIFLRGITVIASFVTVAIMAAAPWGLTKENWSEGRRVGTSSYEEYLVENTEDSWTIFKFGNPIVLPFLLLFVAVETAWEALKWCWQNRVRIANAMISTANAVVTAACFVGSEVKLFVLRTFVYIHSERRTICFVDAALGSLAGFFFGSVAIGVVVGAMLGIINYELVSVRWLKLAPAKAK